MNQQPPQKTLTLLEGLNLYLCRSQRLDEETKRAYNTDVLQLIDFCEGIGVPPTVDIPLTVLDQFALHLKDKGYSVQTICRKIYCYRSLFNFLLKRDLVSKNPANAVELPKRSKSGREVYLVEQETAELLNAISLFPKHQRFSAGLSVETLVFTGIRNEEATEIRVKDIDFHLKKVFIHGKNDKNRHVPLCDRLLQVYYHAVTTRTLKPEDKLLYGLSGKPIQRQSLETIVENAMKYTAIPKHVTPHTIRHSIATVLPNYGALRNDVRMLLGHGIVDTTDIYSHSEIERLRAFVNRYSVAITKLQQVIQLKAAGSALPPIPGTFCHPGPVMTYPEFEGLPGVQVFNHPVQEVGFQGYPVTQNPGNQQANTLPFWVQ